MGYFIGNGDQQRYVHDNGKIYTDEHCMHEVIGEHGLVAMSVVVPDNLTHIEKPSIEEIVKVNKPKRGRPRKEI